MYDKLDELIFEFNDKLGSAIWNHEEKRTFTELIIQECAKVASDHDGAHYVGTAIEKHFGVEE